jgi:hypothetical protein
MRSRLQKRFCSLDCPEKERDATFAPVFSRQREALLAEAAVPEIAIPQNVEECLAGFHRLGAPGRPVARVIPTGRSI